MTAHVFLKIFKISDPLSKYLQTSGLDFMKCNDFVNDFKKKMKAYSRNFEEVKNTVKIFAEKMNTVLENNGIEEVAFGLGTYFPIRRISKKKQMADESISSESAEYPDEHGKYQVNVYNIIMDTVLTRLKKRFLGNMVNIF